MTIKLRNQINEQFSAHLVIVLIETGSGFKKCLQTVGIAPPMRQN
jgi:hypothetical protein